MRLNRPCWLERLRDRLTELREELWTNFFGASECWALMFLLHGLSITVGEDYTSFRSIVEIPMACFGVIAAIGTVGFAAGVPIVIVSSIVYYPVEMSFRAVEFLLTLLKKIRPLLAHVDQIHDLYRYLVDARSL